MLASRDHYDPTFLTIWVTLSMQAGFEMIKDGSLSFVFEQRYSSPRSKHPEQQLSLLDTTAT